MIYATIACLNEADYLEYTLRSLYPVCDRILVAEGANRFSRDFATAEGLSTDGTTELIRQFPDPGGKIQHIPVGFCHCMAELRNAYLREVPYDAIVILTDGDELWDPGPLGEALEYLKAHEEVRALWAQVVMFWGDFNHLIQTDLQVPRIFRREGEDHYRCVETGNMGDIHNRQEEIEFLAMEWAPPLRLYHPGWVRGAPRLLDKTRYTYRYNQAFPTSELYATLQGLSDDDLAWEILTNHHCFTRRLPPGMNLEPYRGPWPPALRDHPFWEKTEREIFREEEYQALLEAWSCA